MVEIIGKAKELDPDTVIVDRFGKSYEYPRKVNALETVVDIDSTQYAMVQEGDGANYSVNFVISMRQGHGGKKQEDAIVEVLKQGLQVPRTRVFMKHLLNVNQALNKKGVVYDVGGNILEGERLKGYAHTLNRNCWVWFNDALEKSKVDEGHLGLELVTITGLENGKPVYKRELLKPCLSKDCYASLDSANEQGFLTEKSPIQKYEAGKSVYFIHPREDSAVRWNAYSVNAVLYCGWYRQDSSPWLGVFDLASAKGASLGKMIDN